MIDTILKKLGVDKVLHFIVGALITFTFGIIFMMQDGVLGIKAILYPLIGVITAMVLEFGKEFIVDIKADWKDILATFLGTVYSYIVFLIGIGFYSLSN